LQLIWSAAAASCALHFLFPSVELKAKDPEGRIVNYHLPGVKWTDGSLQNDVPMQRLGELFNINHVIVSQVNPHVIPFMSNDISNFGERACYFITSELAHRLTQMATIGIFTNLKPLRYLRNLISQQYRGNITIVPDYSLRDYVKLIGLSNPTLEWITECMQKSQRTTWSKLSLIKNQCQIYTTLESCVHRLRDTDLSSHNEKLVPEEYLCTESFQTIQ